MLGVFGTGYVGLVTAVCLAELGFEVLANDLDIEKIEQLNQGNPTIFEPHLKKMLRNSLSAGRIRFTVDFKEVIGHCVTLFLCVGTPSKQDGSTDMSQVEAVVKQIVQNMDGYRLLVVKSTVPVNTADWVKKVARLYAKSKKFPLDVASNPEFLREGAAIYDFLHPDRIVIGVSTPQARERLLHIYSKIECPKVVTDTATAEIIKYASNTFLSTKVSFINMIADLCEKVGADVEQVAEGMGLDPRIGRQFLRAGAGFGGSCFPKDLRAFIHVGKQHNVDISLLEKVIEINQSRPDCLLHHLSAALWVLSGKNVAVLGLAFKPGTDDVRETPAGRLIRKLLEAGAKVKCYDPVATDNFKQMYTEESSRIEVVDSLEECVRGVHAAVLVTEWEEFIEMDLTTLKELMDFPIIIDGRNVLDPQKVLEAGFIYRAVGRNYSQSSSY